MYGYQQPEGREDFEVGFYDPDGDHYYPDESFDTRQKARGRVSFLNGGGCLGSDPVDSIAQSLDRIASALEGLERMYANA